MKTLNLKITTEDLILNEADKQKNPVELVTNTIKNVIIAWGAQKQGGLSEEDRRKYYKISDIFDEVVKKNLESVDIEDDWMGLIRKCFGGFLIPTNLLRQVEKLVQEAKGK